VRVTLTVAPTLNFAMEQSGVPLVSGVRVENLDATALVGARLVLLLQPDLGDATVVPLPEVKGGEATELATVDLRLPPGRLRAVVEAERARLTWRLETDAGTLAEGDADVDVLAYNEWPGFRAPPALLAAFVLPNHPVVGRLLARTRDHLRATTGDPSLSGYQTRSPARARAAVTALYAAVQDLGLTYVGVPASFEAVGQKVRLPDRVLADEMANCLDLTTLLAACIEQMGLAPLLVIVQGHAFPGVWLTDERFPEGVVHDAARLRTNVQLGDVCVFDSSTTVAVTPAGERPPFEAAVAVATEALANDAAFVCAVDVRVVRLDRVRPLPVRIEATVEPAAEGAPVSASHTLLQESRDTDEAAPAPAPPPPPEPVVQRFKRWKDRLLDLSLNNRLLNFRTGARASFQLLVPDLARFEDTLAAAEPFEIHPRPDDDPRDQRAAALADARTDAADLAARRRADLDRRILHASDPKDALLARAVELDRAARTAREEGGANTLFAAIGLLKWYESADAEQPRFAPLLLVPVQLLYERGTRRLRLRRAEDDALGNVTLAEKLRRDHAVDLSALAALAADDSGVDVAKLLHDARAAVRQMPRWEVLDEVHVGLFTFTKFLMWKDLDENADALLQSEVVRHVALGGAGDFPDPVGEPPLDGLDVSVPPGALPTVLDCDSTQLAAVSAALRGRSFVLQGPPGTGKSQTITNLIAGALAEGKTVLFVSEKMAALEVVHRRLKTVGLGDYCLELHSNKSNKKDVVKSLGAALERAERASDTTWDARSAELGALRTSLNASVGASHAPRPIGRTFYGVSARLLELAEAPALRVDVADVAALTEARLRAMDRAVDALAAAGAQVEPVAAHPLGASTATEWSGTGEEALKDALAGARRAVEDARGAAQRVADALGLPAPTSLADAEDLLALAAARAAGPVPAGALDDAWGDTAARARALLAATEADTARREALAERWNDKVFSNTATSLAATFGQWANAFFLFAFVFLFFPRRTLRAAAAGVLPSDRRIAEDLSVALASRQAAAGLAAEAAWATAALGATWDGAPATLAATLTRVEALRDAVTRWRAGGNDAPARWLVPGGPDGASLVPVGGALRAALVALSPALGDVERALGVPLPPPVSPTWWADAAAALLAWEVAMPRFRGWCLYNRAAAEVDALGLAPLVRAHRDGTVAAGSLSDAAERAVLTRWVAVVRDAEPALRDFDGAEQDRRVLRFRAMDRAHVDLARTRVLARLDARRPAPGRAAAEGSETGTLARETRKQRAHMPVRKLLSEIPELLARLKPCLLMSPLSIAQYLPATGRRFDLVVFDEASQISTHDAIGAIARGKQVVIVGDSRQLPPTAFFSKGTSEDDVPDENDVIELESILEEALAARLPQQMLGWHYRSRHEALIDFSNRHYYEGRLNVFPAAHGRVEGLGVRWVHTAEGVYGKGGTRSNRPEAEALVAWLVAELRRTAPGARSFGVVTFSVPQQTLIQDLLDAARAADPTIEAHFADTVLEPVFVKNLENVQGDERDIILFSVCYGPDATGRVWMNFGPLNRTGGERRLNVAVTRARRALRVYSTLTADQIDLSKTNATGARHLKAFLQYVAQHGGAAGEAPVRRAGFAGPFERAVYDALVARGYTVDCQVGCGGYRVDLAVTHPDHPGVYAIGVECDGAAYHAAPTARDRDRLRAEVLQGLGWRLHRVWSSDWWFDRARESAKLFAAVEAAIAAPVEVEAAAPVATVPVAAVGVEAVGVEAVGVEVAPEAAAAPMVAEAPTSAPYVYAALTTAGEPEAFDLGAARAAIRARILEVVAIEAPLSLDELARRVSAAWGITRLTAKPRERVRVEAEALAALGKLRIVDGFVWAHGVDPAAWTTVRGAAADGTTRPAEALPVEEIAAAAARVLATDLAIDVAGLHSDVARAFGFARVGAKLDERLTAGVDVLVRAGRARRDGERVVWVG
jgi:very-short-patch-repair endonuclease/preprotein translocase subunit Sec61beta